MAKAKNGYVPIQITLTEKDYDLLRRVVYEEEFKSPNEAVKTWVLDNLAEYENSYSIEKLYQFKYKE